VPFYSLAISKTESTLCQSSTKKANKSACSHPTIEDQQHWFVTRIFIAANLGWEGGIFLVLLGVCLCLCVFVRVCASMLLHILFLHIHPHKHTLTVYTNPFELVVGAVFVSFISLFFHLTPCVGIYPHNFLPISSTITFARSFVLDRLSSQQSFR
jgi:hypothetical protein